MENKKMRILSKVSLFISVFPLVTFIPITLKITLPEGLSTAWAVVNIACVVLGLILSIAFVRRSESRSLINIVSTVISVFWGFLIVGIVVLALFMNFVQ